MTNWESQVVAITKALDRIEVEVKENRMEVVKLKQEMATGKGAIRSILFLGGIVTFIWTTIKIITLLK
jgi:hypothetical protein|tara:strand:- start:1087 stop:1290 length:204 start_codon:yes stop_codon:yes gene_type:complete